MCLCRRQINRVTKNDVIGQRQITVSELRITAIYTVFLTEADSGITKILSINSAFLSEEIISVTKSLYTCIYIKL